MLFRSGAEEGDKGGVGERGVREEEDKNVVGEVGDHVGRARLGERPNRCKAFGADGGVEARESGGDNYEKLRGP